MTDEWQWAALAFKLKQQPRDFRYHFDEAMDELMGEISLYLAFTDMVDHNLDRLPEWLEVNSWPQWVSSS